MIRVSAFFFCECVFMLRHRVLFFCVFGWVGFLNISTMRASTSLGAVSCTCVWSVLFWVLSGRRSSDSGHHCPDDLWETLRLVGAAYERGAWRRYFNGAQSILRDSRHRWLRSVRGLSLGECSFPSDFGGVFWIESLQHALRLLKHVSLGALGDQGA